MSRAIDDSSVKGKRGMWTPVELPGGNLNQSGINGYATLATKQKGEQAMAAFSRVMVKEIDSLSACALPQVKEHTTEFKNYEGVYTGSDSNRLVISQQDNTLYFVLNNRDQRNFFPLYKSADDCFISIPVTVLFVKNESGEVVKAWCQNMGKSFWLVKSQ